MMTREQFCLVLVWFAAIVNIAILFVVVAAALK